MAFVRALFLACAAASCAAFNPAVSAFGRVGSLRKSVSHAPAARTAPLPSRRAASGSHIAMKGYEIDLTGKVLPVLVFFNPFLLFTTLQMQACIEQQMVKSVFRPCLVHVCSCVCVRSCFQVAFIGGVGDASGYGWGIAKQLANAGATIVIGTWPPVLTLFERSIKKGFGEDSKLIDGSDMKIAKVYLVCICVKVCV